MDTGAYRSEVLTQLGDIRQALGTVLANQTNLDDFVRAHVNDDKAMKAELVGEIRLVEARLTQADTQLSIGLDAAQKSASAARSKVNTAYKIVGVVFAVAGLVAAYWSLFQ